MRTHARDAYSTLDAASFIELMSPTRCACCVYRADVAHAVCLLCSSSAWLSVGDVCCYVCVCSQQAACINIPPAAQSDIRVLMVLYSSRKRSFVGLIPTDQTQFINAIRTLIQNQRKKVAYTREIVWPLSL